MLLLSFAGAVPWTLRQAEAERKHDDSISSPRRVVIQLVLDRVSAEAIKMASR